MKSSKQQIPVLISELNQEEMVSFASVMLRSSNGQQYALGEFARLYRELQQKTITASKNGEYFGLSTNQFSPEIIQKTKKIIAQQNEFSVSFEGAGFDSEVLLEELMFIILISLVLLYLILAAQFESLIQPLIVILTVPVAWFGVFVLLYILRESINLIALIGLVVMSGIVVNDAILKIDMMNQAYKNGSTKRAAIHLAGQRRLRAIIMTSLTTILALVPILFSEGLGAELQTPLVIAVIGGLLLGTWASLYLIPVL